MRIEARGLSDIGRKRPDNEDSFLVDEPLGLFIVCDGMGGHAAGEVAANRCVEVIHSEISGQREVIQQLNANPSSTAAVVSLLEAAVETASSDIFRTAQAEETKRGMGTTAVVLLVAGNKAILAHVGDSRVYLVRSGQVHRLTEDHTFIQAQIKAGILSKDQAESSPYKNVITRAVGIQPSVQVDTLVLDTLPGDRYLLCTDGLHGYLHDDEISRFLSEGEALPETLIALANERGGKDNITAVVVELSQERTATPVDLEMTLDVEARLKAVRNMPLFRHLTYKEQMAVLAVGQVESYPRGKEIVRQDTEGDQLFVVVGGRVSVDTGGIKVAELGLGGHFGEMGIVDNAPRSATVRSMEQTRCLIFKRVDLMGLMRREPVLAVKLLWAFVQVLSERLRAANAELSEARSELEHRVEIPSTQPPFGEV
jgi:PPM family protein phosphatase